MNDILKRAGKYTDILLALGIVGILLVLLFPVPTFLLDILLAFSIMTSILILMTTLFIIKPLEFSVFPSILLVTTIMRLSLNIASTRLILSNGHTGPSAAGHIIQAFGGFVMQGNVVIGLIVFMILTLINFVVITKGSGRIAEVAARFSLDAMPGKQMAIDADLSAGLIDENTAKSRRKELESESTFYGAMDGANKFVRGDAIAGLLITLINLIGGIVIGVLQRGLELEKAVLTYTILTIGDGLVSQIPSIIISLAAGFLVSKAGVVGSADKAIFGQLGQYPQSLWVSSGLTGLMSIIPGLPAGPFLFLSMITGAIAYGLTSKVAVEEVIENIEDNNQKSEIPQEDSPTKSLHLDAIKLEIGYNILSLLNYTKGHSLSDQIKAIRKQVIQDYGFLIPSIRIQDNLQLDQSAYIIKIKEIECGSGQVMIDKFLVMDPQGGKINLPGIDTKEPTFGIAAKWISSPSREEAIRNGYTIIDPQTVITTHITEVIKENITELLSYTETLKLIEEISTQHPKLVKDLIPDTISISTIQKILQNLLSEGVSIRDLPTIIEAVADSIKVTRNISNITENVRMRLSRQISHSHTSDDGFIPVVTLSGDLEKVFMDHLVTIEDLKQLALPPSKVQDFILSFRRTYDEVAMKGIIPVLLTSPTLRPYVRSIIERFRPSTIVMSQNEIHPKSKIKTFGIIS